MTQKENHSLWIIKLFSFISSCLLPSISPIGVPFLISSESLLIQSSTPLLPWHPRVLPTSQTRTWVFEGTAITTIYLIIWFRYTAFGIPTNRKLPPCLKSLLAVIKVSLGVVQGGRTEKTYRTTEVSDGRAGCVRRRPYLTRGDLRPEHCACPAAWAGRL